MCKSETQLVNEDFCAKCDNEVDDIVITIFEIYPELTEEEKVSILNSEIEKRRKQLIEVDLENLIREGAIIRKFDENGEVTFWISKTGKILFP